MIVKIEHPLFKRYFRNETLWHDVNNDRYTWQSNDQPWQPTYNRFYIDGYDTLKEATYGILEEA